MSEVTIFVSSCDSYRAAWTPLCHGFRKYWPDCPWPLMIMTNFLEPPCGRSIETGTDDGWGHMMRRALKQIGSPVILYMMEDAWPCEKVDTRALTDFANIIIRDEADHIRLCPPGSEGRPPKRTFSDERLFVFADDEQYRTSLHAGLWRTSVLKRLVRPEDDPWTFELDGRNRTRGSDRYLCVKKMDYLRYPTPACPGWDWGCIWRGRWTPGAKRYAEREGLAIDFGRQPNAKLDRTDPHL